MQGVDPSRTGQCQHCLYPLVEAIDARGRYWVHGRYLGGPVLPVATGQHRGDPRRDRDHPRRREARRGWLVMTAALRSEPAELPPTAVVGPRPHLVVVDVAGIPEPRPSTKPRIAPQDGYAALATALWGSSMQPGDWQSRAACTGADPLLFDAGRAAGKTLCADCPVRRECEGDQLRWERSRGLSRITDLATLRGARTATERAELHKTTSTTETKEG